MDRFSCPARLAMSSEEKDSPATFICTIDGNHEIHEDEVTGVKWNKDGEWVD